MFMLYALPAGLLAGWLGGGELSRLGDARLRWAPLALIGLMIQVVLFFGPVAERVGDLGMPIYVGSTALVLVVVLRNLALGGLGLVAIGAASNLAAIVANGGSMPASPGALAALGREVNEGYSNSVVMDAPRLHPLTDIFALPPPLPVRQRVQRRRRAHRHRGGVDDCRADAQGRCVRGTSHQRTPRRVPMSDRRARTSGLRSH